MCYTCKILYFLVWGILYFLSTFNCITIVFSRNACCIFPYLMSEHGVDLHVSWCLTCSVCDRLPGKEQHWQLQTLGQHFRGVAEMNGERTGQMDSLYFFGVINTLSPALPINCASTPSNNFTLMWQHGTNRKHPWKKQPIHTSFKWPQLSSRDYKVCVCACVRFWSRSKCEWQPCWRETVTFSIWTVTQSELKAWHRNPAWQEAAWPRRSANASTNGRDHTELIPPLKTNMLHCQFHTDER